jgi:hypothetical protein
VLAAAFIVYAILWSQAPLSTLDTPSYARLARDLQQLHLSQLHQRTPGYPLFMLVTRSERAPSTSLFYLQLALQLAAVGLMVWLLAALKLECNWVLLFLLLALFPVFIAPSAYAETETICQFSIVIAYLSLVMWLNGGHRRCLAVFTVAATYAAFVRPTYEFFVPATTAAVLGFCILVRTSSARLKKMAVSLCIASVLSVGALASYAFLNYKQFGYFDLSYMGVLVLNHKTAGVVEFLPSTFEPMRTILVENRDKLLVKPYDDHTGENYIYRALPDLLQLYAGDRIKMLKAVQRANVHLIIHKPLSYIHDSLKAVANYWMPTEYSELTNGSGTLALISVAVQWVVIAGFFLQVLVVIGVAILWIYTRLLGYSRPISDQNIEHLFVAHAVGIILIIYTMLISCFAGIGESRYRVPTEPIILASTIIGFASLRRIASLLFGPPDESKMVRPEWPGER